MICAGVIGLGVGERHILGYQADPRCKVVKICDSDSQKLLEVGDRFKDVKRVSNAGEIIGDPSIDVVSIASYDQFHGDQVVEAVQAGKHVFVEKPLCLNRRELEAISGALLANPRVKLSSNFILRKVNRFVDLRRRIQSGRFGDIYYLEGDYDYGRLTKILSGWRSKAEGYCVMHGGGTHLIDLICWLVGEKPAEVFGYGNKIVTNKSRFEANDFSVALLKFRSGIVAKISANFGSVTPHHHKVCVYGSECTFEQSHSGAHYLNSRNSPVGIEQLFDAYPGVEKGDMLPDFLDSILAIGPSSVSCQDVLDVMSISLSIEDSIRERRAVEVVYY